MMTAPLPKDEVLEAVNELDGDGLGVHRRPGTDPPMSLKSILALVGELSEEALQLPASPAILARLG